MESLILHIHSTSRIFTLLSLLSVSQHVSLKNSEWPTVQQYVLSFIITVSINQKIPRYKSFLSKGMQQRIFPYMSNAYMIQLIVERTEENKVKR